MAGVEIELHIHWAAAKTAPFFAFSDVRDVHRMYDGSKGFPVAEPAPLTTAKLPSPAVSLMVTPWTVAVGPDEYGSNRADMASGAPVGPEHPRGRAGAAFPATASEEHLCTSKNPSVIFRT